MLQIVAFKEHGIEQPRRSIRRAIKLKPARPTWTEGAGRIDVKARQKEIRRRNFRRVAAGPHPHVRIEEDRPPDVLLRARELAQKFEARHHAACVLEVELGAHPSHKK